MGFTVRYFDLSLGKGEASVTLTENKGRPMAITSDGQSVVAVSKDSCIRLYDTAVLESYGTREKPLDRKLYKVIGSHGGLVVIKHKLILHGAASLTLWDISNDQAQTLEITARQDVSGEMAIFPTGKIASCTLFATITIWDLETGSYTHVFEADGDATWQLAGTPDGRYLVAVSAGGIRCWNLSSGVCRRLQEGCTTDHRGLRGTVVACGNDLAVSSSNGNSIRVWDLTTGACQHEWNIRANDGCKDTGDQYCHNLLAMTEEGTLCLEACSQSQPDIDDRYVRVWDVQTGQCRHVLTGHTKAVSAVAASPGGKLAASAGWDGAVRLWDLASGACMGVWDGLSGHAGECTCNLHFTATGHELISKLDTNTIRAWDVASGQVKQIIHCTTPTPRQQAAAATWSSMPMRSPGSPLLRLSLDASGNLLLISPKAGVKLVKPSHPGIAAHLHDHSDNMVVYVGPSIKLDVRTLRLSGNTVMGFSTSNQRFVRYKLQGKVLDWLAADGVSMA